MKSYIALFTVLAISSAAIAVPEFKPAAPISVAAPAEAKDDALERLLTEVVSERSKIGR